MPLPVRTRDLERCHRTWRALATVVAAASLSPISLRAESSLPWTPDAADRHRLQWLVDEAALALTTTHWPLPQAAVRRALDSLPPTLAPALDEARRQLRRSLQRDTGAGLRLRWSQARDGLAGFGDDPTPGPSTMLRGPAWGDGPAVARLSVQATRDAGPDGRRHRADLEGSAIAVESHGLQWQAWSHRHWWGPGWQNSLVLGSNVPALNGIGLQRASSAPSSSRWLSWLGPWTFELFIAPLGGVGQPADPYLFGQRLTVRPADGLEVGLTRTAQWGGSGRPESLGSFVNMLTGSGLNPTDEEQRNTDAANAMAGIDLRLRCPAGWRCAGYLQLIGEDEAGGLPSRHLGLYGLEAWSADGRHRGHVELAETGCRMPVGRDPLTPCAYRNYAYPEGYVHHGRWLGAGAGPDSRLLTLGWLDTRQALSVRLHAGRIGSRIGRYATTSAGRRDGGRVMALTAATRWRWRSIDIAPEIGWTRLAAAAGVRREARLGLTLSLPLPDLAARTAGSGATVGR